VCQWLFGLLFFGVVVISLLYASMALLAPVCALLHLPVAGEVYTMLAKVCHQQPSRTPWLWGYPLGLCYRCVGAYTGAALYGLACWRFGLKLPWQATLALAVVAVGDKVVWLAFAVDSPAWLRLGCGILLGMVIMDVLFCSWQWGSSHE
jgi:uncharacterized membrane protein